MRSSFEHPFVIDSYLQTKVSSGRVAGPFSAPPFPSLHISRFGVIPKNNQPGKWRLILDLSSPVGHRVNDGICKPPFTVQYVSVDAVIEGIMAQGHGARSYGLGCFWRSLVACWPSVALLHDHVCVCNLYHCSWARGADSCPAVCRFGACGGLLPTLCLRCTRSFVSVAWRGVLVA